MPAGIVGTGNKDLALLGLRLKAAGNGGLRRELLAGLRAATKPLIADVQDAAREQLPRSGGLNEWVADSKLSVRNSLSPLSAGVRIVNEPKKGSSRRSSDPIQFGSDKGSVRHPVFGHKDRKWAETKVRPGWFSKTIERHIPDVTAELLTVIRETATKLTVG